MDVVIRKISLVDRTAWLEMWTAYCAFYETAVALEVTESTWRRIIADDAGVHGLIAVDSRTDVALGFAHYVLHPYTWSEGSACYLEDLFVREDARGAGIGYAMIERLVALGALHGWARLYWMTRETNANARRLYDRFGQRDDFVRYDIALHRAGAQTVHRDS